MARIEEVRQAGGMAEVVRPLEDVHKIFGVEPHQITLPIYSKQVEITIKKRGSFLNVFMNEFEVLLRKAI
jgi:hypothetical protein